MKTLYLLFYFKAGLSLSTFDLASPIVISKLKSANNSDQKTELWRTEMTIIYTDESDWETLCQHSTHLGDRTTWRYAVCDKLRVLPTEFEKLPLLSETNFDFTNTNTIISQLFKALEAHVLPAVSRYKTEKQLDMNTDSINVLLQDRLDLDSLKSRGVTEINCIADAYENRMCNEFKNRIIGFIHEHLKNESTTFDSKNFLDYRFKKIAIKMNNFEQNKRIRIKTVVIRRKENSEEEMFENEFGTTERDGQVYLDKYVAPRFKQKDGTFTNVNGDPILDGRTGQSFEIQPNQLYCLNVEGLAVLHKVNGSTEGFKNGYNFEILRTPPYFLDSAS